MPIPMNAQEVMDIEASQLLDELGLGEEEPDSADPFRQSKKMS